MSTVAQSDRTADACARFFQAASRIFVPAVLMRLHASSRIPLGLCRRKPARCCSVDQAADDADGAGCVQHMHGGVAIGGRDLDGGVGLAGRRAADQQGNLESLPRPSLWLHAPSRPTRE